VPSSAISIASVAFHSYVFEPVHSRDGVREQLVDIDTTAGPLIIIFAPGQNELQQTTLFVAREARNDEVVAVTINVALRVLEAVKTSR
jgi:hypothetical protein